MRGLMWFRSDLRVSDNTALFNASRHCRDGVLGVFFIPTKTWIAHHMAPCKVDLILRQLVDIQTQLESVNIPLHVKVVDGYDDCSDELVALCKAHDIKTVYYNREYEFDEMARDGRASDRLESMGVEACAYNDSLIVPPGRLLTPKGQPYTQYAPFRKAWHAWMPRHGNLQPLGLPELQVERFAQNSNIPAKIEGFHSTIDPALWPAGEAYAYQCLEQFVKGALFEYSTLREFPATEGTSRLSPYLNIGAISVRHCFSLAMCAKVRSNEDLDKWISELIWREFYKHLVFHCPRLCQGHAFHEAYDTVDWDHRPDWIAAWEKGETGYPLVDAGMRQLLQTGWMHNRLRMICAMFFTKLMFQDWRMGEAFFMRHLIDGDFSANNGGWQWCASSGADPSPALRIFSPSRQIASNDPQGEFVKRYIPELADFSPEEIAEPYMRNPSKAKATGYPRPILDYHNQRKIALAQYKDVEMV